MSESEDWTMTDLFEVVNIRPDESAGTVDVTVIFNTQKEFTFTMSEDEFEPSKEYIGKEIHRQLTSSE